MTCWAAGVMRDVDLEVPASELDVMMEKGITAEQWAVQKVCLLGSFVRTPPVDVVRCCLVPRREEDRP